MDHPILYFMIALIGIALVAYLLYADRKRIRLQRLRVQKLYASPMFEEMRPLLQRARRLSVESLTIDRTGFHIRFLFPYGYEDRFLMAERGYDDLTPEKQEALLLLLEEILPKLTTHDCYSFQSFRKKMLDGHVEYRYRYIIQIDYKNLLTRAPYYDGTLQSQVW